MTVSRRFAGWPPYARLAVLGIVVLAIVGAALAVGPLQDYATQSSRHDADKDLYRAVIDHVRHGEGFYSASVAEQLERDYPVRPAMTVREPTLTWLLAGLGGWRHGIAVLAALAVVAGLAMIKGLESVDTRRAFFLLSGLGALVAFGPYVGPIQVTQHECWAGLLVVLSLAVRTSERFAAAVVLGLVACLFRELAAPYLVIMAVAAMGERRRREATAWIAAGGLFAVTYAVHLWAVARQTSASDPESPGWFAHDGLTHVLETVRLTTFAGAGPDLLSVLVLVLGLLGWASIASPLANRVLAWIAFWVVLTLFVGRPENIVWGFLWAGPLVLGMVLAPGALRDLAAITRWNRSTTR
ncbi:hypothetical protein [Aeromicrobium ginsengisoli]|uniref:DUF2029 domain-containing protein n=1 Tax=Aeromicrobium ginsengisoli TaxID=363867 RepID=A0A5M4FJS6_9ACTN|nr:hypothetical protein [Aeromicrobium ginsengisoli]KAA1400414.1 hypothetical protein ESP70_006750 [Aeromicrobium ginsengisoli]